VQGTTRIAQLASCISVSPVLPSNARAATGHQQRPAPHVGKTPDDDDADRA
jgi:hypothetical protein